MVDAGKALRPTGGYTYDPAANGGTGGDVEATEDLFDSRCKLQARNLVTSDSEVGGRTSTTVRFELHLPADTDPLTRGDIWELTALSSLSLLSVGQRFRVQGPAGKSLATARRYEVEVVVS